MAGPREYAPSRPAARLRRDVRAVALILVTCGLVQCSDPLDVCTPTESRLGFFSKGDCIVTRASFFQGHEWLTWFGNRDLPEAYRFSETEIHAVAEGNRRVDWPAELLIHLNNSVVTYVLSVQEFADRPENQRFHFLLSSRNTLPEAFADSLEAFRELTHRAVDTWPTNRERALTLVGQAVHLLQDSFSEAHSIREPDNARAPWCVRDMKAYIERDDGFDTPDIHYHGLDEDETGGVGHTTPQDSIYRQGRDCHEPTTSAEVDACLSPSARRARVATRDYLALVRRLTAGGLSGPDLDQATDRELDEMIPGDLELCP